MIISKNTAIRLYIKVPNGKFRAIFTAAQMTAMLNSRRRRAIL
ncbi:hypothetical protein ETAC_08840 [Edwardsiella piscicida C07-087]|nr:hypothetical protein ETAC_08840 [Edwardsiella piscicida C07-087]